MYTNLNNNNWNNGYTSSWNYKKINKNLTYSAGILPYTFDQNGKCMFLLGKDNEGSWSDFGGRSEFKDHNDEKNTACREFYEETLGAVINIQECMEKININPFKIVSKTLNGSPYYMFLIYIDYYNYSESFYKISNYLRYTYNNDKRIIYKLIEKNTIRWVSMDTVLNCIENKNTNTPITLRGVFYKTMDKCKDQLLFLQR
jgi:hypothetical protein